MNCTEEPLQKFLDGLAARTPAGRRQRQRAGRALGVAAGQMAAAFTTDQEKFKSVAAAALELQGRLRRFQTALFAPHGSRYCGLRGLNDCGKGVGAGTWDGRLAISKREEK